MPGAASQMTGKSGVGSWESGGQRAQDDLVGLTVTESPWCGGVALDRPLIRNLDYPCRAVHKVNSMQRKKALDARHPTRNTIPQLDDCFLCCEWVSRMKDFATLVIQEFELCLREKPFWNGVTMLNTAFENSWHLQ